MIRKINRITDSMIQAEVYKLTPITRITSSLISRVSTRSSRPQIRKMSTKVEQSALMKPMAFRRHPDTVIAKLVYGTAWKKEQSARLVYEAIQAGFRAIDTAAQPRHYNEAQVGEGIRRAIAEGLVTREDLYVRYHYMSTERILIHENRFKQNSHPRQVKTTTICHIHSP